MWEIQPDWTMMDSFYVCAGGNEYKLTRKDDQILCKDGSVTIKAFQKSFTMTVPEIGTCSFIAPKNSLDIHSEKAINCVDVSPDGKEILTGDADGKLFLTHIGTDPVPLPGPTENFGVEDCLIDAENHRFFAASADFRIYEYSATEYEYTGKYEGHRSCVNRIQLRDNTLYSGSRDRVLAFWDTQKRTRISSSTMTASVNDFCFADCGSIFTACDNGVFAVDARTGMTATSPGYKSSATFTTIATLGNDLVGGLDDGKVVQWDIRNMQEAKSEWSWYDASINKLTYNNGELWCLTNDGTGACIDVSGKKSTVILGTRSYAPLRDIAFRKQLSAWTADGEGMLVFFDF